MKDFKTIYGMRVYECEWLGSSKYDEMIEAQKKVDEAFNQIADAWALSSFSTYGKMASSSGYLLETDLIRMMEDYEFLTSASGTCFDDQRVKITRHTTHAGTGDGPIIYSVGYDVYDSKGNVVSKGHSCSCTGGFANIKPYPGCAKKSKKTIMQKLNMFIKKVLDSDLKTLIKAGYIDECLNLTQEGREALIAILFFENKAALVKAAEEKLAEEKEEKENK